MFKKTNKTTIIKNKTKILIDISPFDSRLYLDISRSLALERWFEKPKNMLFGHVRAK
jgi:hypothetical protein